MDKDLGTLEQGKLADIVLVNENPLKNLQVLYGTGAIRLDESGKTKRVGEIEIIRHLKHYFIVRTSWLYSSFGNNFMKTMLKLANERNSLNPVFLT